MDSTKDLVAAEYRKTLAARETQIRESWIGAMEARIVRDELIKCQKSEGVNNWSECKHLSELYLKLLKTNKVHGYKTIDIA